MNGKYEFGDYQTPRLFAKKVCAYLRDTLGLKPSIVIEPTCGMGNFLSESRIFSADRYCGIEINEEYCRYCRDAMPDSNVEIINGNFFSFPLSRLTGGKQNILLIGNPPWVTNTALSAAEAGNLPEKANFKRLKGIEAITGYSNFDICESMILKMVHECRNSDTVIAMLCKTSVARNIYQEIIRERIPFKSCKVLAFDSMKIFDVRAKACLMVLCLSSVYQGESPFEESSFDFPDRDVKEYYCVDGNLRTKTTECAYDFEGFSCFEWRQGIKHDCAKVVELTSSDGDLVNGLNEKVCIERRYLYPLIKSSMIKAPVITEFSKYLIVTQKKVNDDTNRILSDAPMTWNYLLNHREMFDRRKSVIYAKSPSFAMFGVGNYSFSRYKVAISGFYKKAKFSLLYDSSEPVMLDDTCYFLSFSSWASAYAAMLFLNDDRVLQFLKNIAFLDSKRPYTKKLLQRLDFSKIIKVVSYDDLLKNEKKLEIPPELTEEIYREFVDLCNTRQAVNNAGQSKPQFEEVALNF